MKQLLSLLLCVAMVLALDGCSGKKNDEPTPETPVEPLAAESASAPEKEAEEKVLKVEAPEVDVDGAYLVLDTADAYEEPYFFVTEDGGAYTFESANAVGYEDIAWNIYVLDEEFTDGLRYLSQAAEPTVVSSGTVNIDADHYVYCECTMNTFTEDLVEGASTLVVHFESAGSGDSAVKDLTLDSADAFQGAYLFQAAEDGTYQAVSTTAEDFDPADVGSDQKEIVWTFYVLDEEFEDSTRYLPQAFENVLEGDGSFEVKAGQYVYCVCSLNGFTAERPAEGMNTLTLTLS